MTTGRGVCGNWPRHARQARIPARSSSRPDSEPFSGVIRFFDRRQGRQSRSRLGLGRQAQTDHAAEVVGIDDLALLGDGQLALTHQAQRRGLHLGQHPLPLLGLQFLGHIGRFNALAADVFRIGLGQFFKNGCFDWIAHRRYMLHREIGKKAKPTWPR